MTDYGCYPIWDMDEIGNIDPKELPITEELIAKLFAWAGTYDATLDHENPASSKFPSEEAEVEFEQTGLELRLELQSELGDKFEVHYFSQKVGRLLALEELN